MFNSENGFGYYEIQVVIDEDKTGGVCMSHQKRDWDELCMYETDGEEALTSVL